MAKELRNIDVQYISLVKSGANRKHIIVKSPDYEEGQGTISRLIKIEKVDPVKHMVYGLVYSPNDIDSTDTDDEFVTEVEIEKACERFMKQGLTPNVDVAHSWKKEDGAFIRESWIVKSGDPMFPDEGGAWAVGIKVEKEELWGMVEAKEIAGLSLGGFAEKISVDTARGEGKGVGGDTQGDGGADVCQCPACGATTPHEKGVTCSKTLCPECGTKMEGVNKSMDTKEKLQKEEQENLSMAAKFGGMIKSFITKESSTFEEVVDDRQFWDLFYALDSACYQILADKDLDHSGKMAKIAQSLDQFKASFATLKTEKMDVSQLEKAGKVFSTQNFDKLVNMMDTLQGLVGQAQTEKTQKEDRNMDQEKVIKELTERIDKLENPEAPAADGQDKVMKETLEKLQTRIDKLETPEAPAGSAGAAGEVPEAVQTLQKAVDEIGERLGKLETPEGETTEKSEELTAIEKTLTGISERLEKVEKTRGISHKEDQEPTPTEKEESSGADLGLITPKTKHFG